MSFNPNPRFLGVTDDLELSFAGHASYLKQKFSPRLQASRSIGSSTWGPTKESLAQLCKTFVRPILSYASARWYPFMASSPLHYKIEVLHRAACRFVSACLSSSPTISYYWRLIFLPSRPPFPIRYLLFRASSASTFSAFSFAHTGLEPCLEAPQMSFLTLPLFEARFTAQIVRKEQLILCPAFHHGTLPTTQFLLL